MDRVTSSILLLDACSVHLQEPLKLTHVQLSYKRVYILCSRYIGHTSPECLQNPEEELSEPTPALSSLAKQTEAEVIATVLSQRNAETEYLLHW